MVFGTWSVGTYSLFGILKTLNLAFLLAQQVVNPVPASVEPPPPLRVHAREAAVAVPAAAALLAPGAVAVAAAAVVAVAVREHDGVVGGGELLRKYGFQKNKYNVI